MLDKDFVGRFVRYVDALALKWRTLRTAKLSASHLEDAHLLKAQLLIRFVIVKRN